MRKEPIRTVRKPRHRVLDDRTSVSGTLLKTRLKGMRSAHSGTSKKVSFPGLGVVVLRKEASSGKKRIPASSHGKRHNNRPSPKGGTITITVLEKASLKRISSKRKGSRSFKDLVTAYVKD